MAITCISFRTTNRSSLVEEIIVWGERRLRAQGIERNLRIPIDGRARGWRTILTQKGYQPSEPTLIQRSCSLDAVTSAQSLPGNYRLSHVQNAAQLTGWATAYEDAFAPEVMTSDIHRSVSLSPLYRPELDLIACNGDGVVVAFALAWFDPESASGTFEPVGCVPAHQRKGLSRALMSEGLQRLKLLGAQRAFVTTTRGRIAAGSLYESVGFRVEANFQTWSKLL